MLKIRIITAFTLLPLILSALIYGPSWFVALFLFICMCISVFEASMILIPALCDYFSEGKTPADRSRPRFESFRDVMWPTIAVVVTGLIFMGIFAEADRAGGLVVVCLLLALLIGVFSARTIGRGIAHSIGMIMAIVYAGLPWLTVWLLYLMGENSRYIILLLATTWCGDTGGYFGGRFFGGKIFGDRKLAPNISPKKTWEGAIMGLLLSVLGASITNLCFAQPLASWPVVFTVGAIGGIFEQLGDLVESSLKRFAKVKDSGMLVPGHGGFLDRVDGLVFASPVIWLILTYFR